MSMMSNNGRVLVAATVTDVGEGTFVYPACERCYCKRTVSLVQDYQFYRCHNCRHVYNPCQENYRYRLRLTITDNSALTNVTAFGGMLNSFFGVTATEFQNKYVSAIQTKYGMYCDNIIQVAVEQTFLGQRLLFGLKTATNFTIKSLQGKDVARCDGLTLKDICQNKDVLTQRKTLKHLPEFVAAQVVPQTDSALPPTVIEYLRRLQTVIDENHLSPEICADKATLIHIWNSCSRSNESTHSNVFKYGRCLAQSTSPACFMKTTIATQPATSVCFIRADTPPHSSLYDFSLDSSIDQSSVGLSCDESYMLESSPSIKECVYLVKSNDYQCLSNSSTQTTHQVIQTCNNNEEFTIFPEEKIKSKRLVKKQRLDYTESCCNAKSEKCTNTNTQNENRYRKRKKSVNDENRLGIVSPFKKSDQGSLFVDYSPSATAKINIKSRMFKKKLTEKEGSLVSDSLINEQELAISTCSQSHHPEFMTEICHTNTLELSQVHMVLSQPPVMQSQPLVPQSHPKYAVTCIDNSLHFTPSNSDQRPMTSSPNNNRLSSMDNLLITQNCNISVQSDDKFDEHIKSISSKGCLIDLKLGNISHKKYGKILLSNNTDANSKPNFYKEKILDASLQNSDNVSEDKELTGGLMEDYPESEGFDVFISKFNNNCPQECENLPDKSKHLKNVSYNITKQESCQESENILRKLKETLFHRGVQSGNGQVSCFTDGAFVNTGITADKVASISMANVSDFANSPKADLSYKVGIARIQILSGNTEDRMAPTLYQNRDDVKKDIFSPDLNGQNNHDMFVNSQNKYILPQNINNKNIHILSKNVSNEKKHILSKNDNRMNISFLKNGNHIKKISLKNVSNQKKTIFKKNICKQNKHILLENYNHQKKQMLSTNISKQRAQVLSKNISSDKEQSFKNFPQKPFLSQNINQKKQMLFQNVNQNKQIIPPHQNKQIIPPHQNKQIIPPHQKKQIRALYKKKQIISPHKKKQSISCHQKKQIISPHQMKQIISPHQTKQIISPHQKKQSISSHQKKQIISPHQKKQIISPHQKKQILSPHGKKIFLPAPQKQLNTVHASRLSLDYSFCHIDDKDSQNFANVTVRRTKKTHYTDRTDTQDENISAKKLCNVDICRTNSESKAILQNEIYFHKNDHVSEIVTELGDCVTELTEQIDQLTEIAERGGQVTENTEQVGQVIEIAEQVGQVIEIAEQVGQVIEIAEQVGQVIEIAEQGGQVTENTEQIGQITNITEQEGQVTQNTEQGLVAEITEQGGHVTQTPLKRGQVTKNTEQGDQVAENTDQGRQVAENTDQGRQVAENTDQGHQVAENTEQGDQVTENTDQGRQVAENTEQGDQVAENTDQGRQVAENTDQGRQVAENTEQGCQVAENTEQGDQVTENTEQGRQVTENTEQGDQLAEITEECDGEHSLPDSMPCSVTLSDLPYGPDIINTSKKYGANILHSNDNIQNTETYVMNDSFLEGEGHDSEVWCHLATPQKPNALKLKLIQSLACAMRMQNIRNSKKCRKISNDSRKLRKSLLHQELPDQYECHVSPQSSRDVTNFPSNHKQDHETAMKHVLFLDHGCEKKVDSPALVPINNRSLSDSSCDLFSSADESMTYVREDTFVDSRCQQSNCGAVVCESSLLQLSLSKSFLPRSSISQPYLPQSFLLKSSLPQSSLPQSSLLQTCSLQSSLLQTPVSQTSISQSSNAINKDLSEHTLQHSSHNLTKKKVRFSHKKHELYFFSSEIISIYPVRNPIKNNLKSSLKKSSVHLEESAGSQDLFSESCHNRSYMDFSSGTESSITSPRVEWDSSSELFSPSSGQPVSKNMLQFPIQQASITSSVTYPVTGQAQNQKHSPVYFFDHSQNNCISPEQSQESSFDLFFPPQHPKTDRTSPVKDLFSQSPDKTNKMSPFSDLFSQSPDVEINRTSPAPDLLSQSPDDKTNRTSPVFYLFSQSPDNKNRMSPFSDLFLQSPDAKVNINNPVLDFLSQSPDIKTNGTSPVSNSSPGIVDDSADICLTPDLFS